MKLNLTIGKKIMLGYAVALLIITVIGVVSYRNTTFLIETARQVNYSQGVLTDLERVLSLMEAVGNGQRGYIVAGDESFLEPHNAAVTAIEAALAELRKATRENTSHLKKLDAVETLVNDRIQFAKATIDLRRTSGFEAAQKMVATQKGSKLMDDLRKLVGEMKAAENDLLGQRSKASDASARQTISVLVVGSISAFIVLAITGLLIARSITRPLGAFMGFVEHVGSGDLTRKAANSTTDELGKLGHSLNLMVSGLRDVATQTRSAAENLNAATAEILASTKQQVASAGEQAAAVQQTTATVEEISQTGAQISDKAKKVSAAAENTAKASTAGLQAVQAGNRTTELIREQAEAVAENIVVLSQKTQAVGEIISTVNDIAEQSNLLALNAAIEAATAGDQGRRFSVVATEMKSLADQAKQATIQVRSILGEIQKGINTSVMLTEEAVKRVESGKQQADVTEKTIRQMSDGIQESVQAFQQILAATGQQQIGLEQVAQAMKSIRQATEQTAAGTSQQEKAAAGINALSQQLRKAVERYQI